MVEKGPSVTLRVPNSPNRRYTTAAQDSILPHKGFKPAFFSFRSESVDLNHGGKRPLGYAQGSEFAEPAVYNRRAGFHPAPQGFQARFFFVRLPSACRQSIT